MSSSAHTTSLRSEATNGRAIVLGTGVTRPTQRAESSGWSVETGMIRRRRSPATAAKRCIICS